jgi:hypothetical protein
MEPQSWLPTLSTSPTKESLMKANRILALAAAGMITALIFVAIANGMALP